MAPQIKQDLNRSGWETTDFPSVCEPCLPANPYVKILRDDHGAECKLCTRPFTVFSWPADRSQNGRKKRTNICLTCARLKNCCQSCMLDLSFGLPIAIRDAALKMVAPGPGSSINREYFAQNMEKEIEEGRGGTEEYEKTDEKARELLRRLATSKPYFRKGRTIEDPTAAEGSAMGGSALVGAGVGGPGPIRSRDSRAAADMGAGPSGMSRGRGRGGSRGGGRGGHKRPLPSATQQPPGPKDWLPPSDKSIMSLFVTGVEDDLPEFKIRDFFKEHGKIKSLICSHMSHCAFINYETREGAEKAAEACQGRVVIAGCPLRVRWSIPKTVGTMSKEQRAEMARDGRSAFGDVKKKRMIESGDARPVAACGGEVPETPDIAISIAAPPGAGDVEYASLAGN